MLCAWRQRLEVHLALEAVLTTQRAIDRALDPDGRQNGVTAEFKKDRAATVDPH